MHSSLFQFTPLREGRPDIRFSCFPGDFISIHAPPRGATAALVFLAGCGADFNSRPSARGDSAVHAVGGRMLISIHAPPRGATMCFGMALHSRFVFQFTPLREGRPLMSRVFEPDGVFQFTPLREGRRWQSADWTESNSFQFTPLREGRLKALNVPDEAIISIHAPPRGATGDCFRCRPLLLISIHAPPRGATASSDNCGVLMLFQFTPLREGRHRRRSHDGSPVLFQFTPLREGRREPPSLPFGRCR